MKRTWKQDEPYWKAPSLRRNGSAASGPWDGEPDKMQWVSETGLDCLIVRNPLGALCGYVGVSQDHPWFQFSYNDCVRTDCDCEGGWERWEDQHTPESLIEVHGGLTFSGRCKPSEKGEAYGICHVPEPGRPHEIQWFGFDCAHAGDLMPDLDAVVGDGYRDIAYVENEVEGLARQLAVIS